MKALLLIPISVSALVCLFWLAATRVLIPPAEVVYTYPPIRPKPTEVASPYDSAKYQAKREARAALLQQRLSEAMEVEISGVSFFSEVRRYKPKDSEKYKVNFTLKPWRIGNGPLETERELYVRQEVSASELKLLENSIDSLSIYTMKARVARMPEDDYDEAILIGLPTLKKGDAELEKAADALVERRTITAPGIGEFVLDHQYHKWDAQLKTPQGEVAITLAMDNDREDPAPTLARAAELVTRFEQWDAQARVVAARDLLDYLNTDWRSEGAGKTSARRFKELMVLQSITFTPQDKLTFIYASEALFESSEIYVTGSIAHGWEAAETDY